MRNSFYWKMAADSIRKNWKMYFPFIISCISTIMMTYIIQALSTNPGLSEIPGGENLKTILSMGYFVLILFSTIFLFYMNSFLMKNRKREFGVYNILGMDKKHIMKMLAFETFYIAVCSMIIGLIAGTILNKVCVLLIRQMMGADVALGFEFSSEAVVWTLSFFIIIFLLILLGNISQIRLANPIDLLKSGNVGEQEPKTKWVLSIVGVLLTGWGYYIALTLQSPISGMPYAFLSAVLIIAGTYLLFTTGSIAVLKILKNNKKYYYQTSHFIPVSGMLYRMKKNAVGLGNITVLSVGVILLLSIAVSLYIVSGNKEADSQYAGNVISEVRLPEDADETGEEIKAKLRELIDQTASETNNTVTDVSSYTYLNLVTLAADDGFEVTKDAYSMLAKQSPASLYLTDQESYNQLTSDNVSLDENEVYVHGTDDEYTKDTLSLMDFQFSVNVMEDMEEFSLDNETTSLISDTYYIIVEDIETLRQIEQQQKEIVEDYAASTNVSTQISLEQGADEQQEIEFGEQLRSHMEQEGMEIVVVDSRTEAASDLQALRSGVLFIVLNLAVLLLLMTVLIIYYKQTSEAYDDKERFSILQKIGLNQSEIKKAIKSQILTVFFLPVIVTGIHILAIFLLMRKLMILVMINQVNLFPISVLIAFLVFLIVYVIIYRITARVYYKIVH
ncbi:ABC transporter permease [Oceanobacillus neutriphilus]|uniref:ABC transporter permease n=1 Tax=Oceanobacillus neutriphilus TaxID=531815 RepID=A0ABQ2NU76_9BACI|nr:ABC transporter permease [Oceanobacillus neutriphilus]GGP10633.1 ABC transporter permease [Oceanobacillus neutriphilus]